MIYTSLLVCSLFFAAALCAPEQVQEDTDKHVQNAPAMLHSAPLEKRSPHYDFGLGKRAYSYVSEYKRLPVYNFGLGKRSRLYSFGLGKRSVDESQSDEDFSNEIDDGTLSEMFDNYDENPGYEEKRARPYSFGLGKRFSDDEPTEEKRARMYDFGLGKRLPLYNFGLGKRARNYNFGLGKRLSKYNFGLGKRLSKYNFGLGKRSADDIDETVDPDV